MQVIPQNKWQLQRLGKFTSSNIHCLFSDPRSNADKAAGKLSDGAMTYIMTCASELLTGTYRDLGNLRALEWGNTYEPIAAELLKEDYPTLQYFGKENPHFFPLTKYSGGSPDAITAFPGKIVFEIKAPENPVNHLAFLQCKHGNDLKELERKYWDQLQMNMVSTATHLKCSYSEMKGIFVSYCPLIKEDFAGLRLKQVEVYPDKDFKDELMKRISRAEAKLKEVIQNIC